MHAAPTARSLLLPEAHARRWEAECHGKDSYTEAAAQAMLAHIKREPGRQRLCWLTTYQCSFCGSWHLGNTRKKAE